MSKKHKDWKNLEDYRKGKDQLKNAILQHPTEGSSNNSIYDYMQGQVNRRFWVKSYSEFKKNK
jgi:hypothetical protein